MTKLRISSHHLQIEKGRYQGVPPDQRLCQKCDSGEVENEIHFLFKCSHYDRTNLNKIITENCVNFSALDLEAKLLWLLSCENEEILTQLCTFITDNLN